MNPARQRRALDALLFAILLAAPCLLLARALAGGAIPFFMDPAMYFFPLRAQAARILAAGEWPLWNRCLMGGMPLLENPQAAVVYPFHWPSLLWPTGFWFTFPQLFQLGLYGALTAWALRRLGVGRWVAFWIGALALAGDYGWSRLQFGNYLNILPWWPLWLGAAQSYANAEGGMRNREKVRNAEGGMRNPGRNAECGMRNAELKTRNSDESPATDLSNPESANVTPHASSIPHSSLIPHSAFRTPHSIQVPHLIFGVLAVAMLLLSGAHQPAAYGLAALAGYVLLEAVFDGEGRGRRLAFPMLTFTLGGLIAAPGWLPQMAFVGETARAGGLDRAQVLAGAVDSAGQLARSLVGNWDVLIPERIAADAAPRWADAEYQAAIGLVALVLALVIPRPGPRRRAWLALWLTALATLALALRPVAGWLLDVVPQAAGLFHNPSRWLGVTQWLLLMAAGLGADRLARAAILRGRLAAIALTLPCAAAVAFQGYVTWRSTDLAMLPATALTDPGQSSLLAQAGLRPGERFFSLDWNRASSYDYRRADLTAWMLPNLAMLWGAEDLGGYEPAQSRRWRAFMDELNGPPWRRLWPGHFALATGLWRDDLFDQANVRAALMPRWGVPLYFRPAGAPGAWVGVLPDMRDPLPTVCAILIDGDGASVAMAREGARQAELLSDPRPLGPANDLVVAGTSATLARAAPTDANRLWAAHSRIESPATTAPEGMAWQLTIGSARPGAARLVDVFCWNRQLARLWQPIEIPPVFSLPALMRYAGRPSRSAWAWGQGTVLGEEIRHNRLTLQVEVASPRAGLVIHDAWWPGWRARLADGTPVAVTPAGPWRKVELPAGRHRLELEYRPVWLGRALMLSAAGLLALMLALLTKILQARR